MRSLISLLLSIPALAAPPSSLPVSPSPRTPVSFAVLAQSPGAWPRILECVGFREAPAPIAGIFVLRAGAPSADWEARVEKGAVVVLEGESSTAETFGFRARAEKVRVGSITDVHRPKLPIIWQRGLELPVYDIPADARVFARERWGGAPVLAGYRRGAGAVLWVATEPGEQGYERYPYLLHALADLGVDPPLHSARLWAFFDYAYRSRVDVDYFAARWRAAGIAALHAAAWHFFEPDGERDRFLRDLIAACHRNGIQVYAWLELPHVSEKFWADHPEWREKTAVLQDAHLDWRKLMNLANRDCFRAVSAGVRQLIDRFDWDGVNLAELYFESLEGMDNAARFTPMNEDVRTEFRAANRFDPLELFQGARDPGRMRAFLDFRAGLARRMQKEWIGEIEKSRAAHPDLDLVLTHVDDRFDTRMRDAVGADAAAVLPMAAAHSFTFLIEDPATVWHLGPQRYAEIAKRYQSLAPRGERLAIDINVVDRYQDVYPTKQQTGTELLQLVHLASGAFARVALYFENSLLAPDWKLLPSAGAAAKLEVQGDKLRVESAAGVGIPWSGPARVDGKEWPVASETRLWLPAGAHQVERGAGGTGDLRIADFNGELKSASAEGGAVELAYESSARAFAVLSREPQAIEIDGAETKPTLAGARTVILPRGQHVVTIK